MRLLRYLPLGLLALLVGGVAGFWWLGGDEAQRWLARNALEIALDRPVVIDGTVEVELGTAPMLQLTGLRIDNPSWAEAPTMLRVERAEVQIALRPLLERVVLLPRIALQGVSIDLETAADGRHSWQSDARPELGEPRGLPLFGSLSVSDVAITYRDRQDGRQVDVRIAKLVGQPDATSGQIKLDATGEINGNAFELNGSSGSLETALMATAPYPLDLDIRLPGIEGTLKGTIANVARTEGLDLQLSLQSASLRTAAAAWHLSVPVEAQLKGGTKLNGDLATLALRDLDAELTSSGGDRVKLAGHLDDVWQGTGLDGTLTLKLDSTGDVQQLLPADWRVLDRIEASAHVTGSIAAPVFSDLSADIGGPGHSDLQLAGMLKLTRASDRIELEGFDLSSTLAVPNPSAFSDLLGFDPAALGAVQSQARLSLADRKLEITALKVGASTFGGLSVEGQGLIGTLAADHVLQLAPQLSLSATMTESAPLLALVDDQARELGPIDATGRLVRDENGVRLEDLEINLGTADQLVVHAKGSLDPLMTDDPGATGVALAVDFAWPSNRVLQPFAGRYLKDLPDLGKGEGQLQLGGTVNGLRIDGARLKTKRNDGIVVAATGSIASLLTEPALSVEGAAFDLDAQGPSTTVVAKLFGYELPDFGRVRARAKLSQARGIISLRTIDLDSGPTAEPTIKVKGAIGDVLAFRRVALTSDFKVPTRTVLAMADIHGKAEIGRLHGKARLSDDDGTMGLDHLEAEVRETHLLSFTLEGLLGDFDQLDQVEFTTSLAVPNLANLADVFDADASGLEQFRFDGKLAGSRGKFDADGTATLGKTDFSGVLSGDLKSKRPSFSGRIRSPHLRLVDFGLSPKAVEETGGTAGGPQSGTARLFDDQPLPLDRLRAIDLNLDVQLDEIEGIALAIKQAKAKLRLVDGTLDLSPLQFELVGGHSELHAEIDARQTVPTWHVRAVTNDAALGNIWQQLQTEVPLEGNLDLDLDLQARGSSPRAMAASLEGDLGLSIQRGRINSRLFALTTMSPFGWLFAKSTRRGYSKFDCFIARFHAEHGLAELQALVLDTPDAIATGTGYIDFAREMINLQIHPRAKHRSFGAPATPFAIAGSLAAPTVEVSTLGAAAHMAGQVALTPINLLGSLVSMISNLGKDNDNPCLKISTG